MIKHRISLHGPGARGTHISAFLLKDLLDVLTDGTKGALRLRIDGRSTAPGSDPAWLDRASNFDFLGLSKGSSVLELEAPALAEAAPEKFAQQNLFWNIDTTSSAFAMFTQSFDDAINGRDDSDLYDDNLLQTYARLNYVFAEGIESLEIINGFPTAPKIRVTAESIERVKKLRRETPPSQASRIAGQLNTIRYSDRMFELILKSGETLRGVAPADYDTQQLADQFGKNVVVVGRAVFRPSGSVLRIDASKIEQAADNIAVWSKTPVARKHTLDRRELIKPQGSQTGLNRIWDKWPGNETDEQVREALKQ